MPQIHPTSPKPRGAFLNTEPAQCSIFESGRMVFDCLKDSREYSLDYITLDEIDLEYIEQHAKFRLKKSSLHASGERPDYDFWVINYHPATMAPHFPAQWLRHLPGKKFSIVLEVEPDDPIKHVRASDFDNHIVLDPSAVRTEKVTPFPRPLSGMPRPGRALRQGVPVIGSFGMGTPGKGFEHLIEAVNREFDAAVVRINVPASTYADDVMYRAHQRPYAEHLEDLCKRVAKPGIRIEFSQRFMEPEELVDWCAENDLNCFFYTRRQSGLSATTDQCILSGQPLLVTSNDTFRHIHRFIRPYPRTGLREAMTSVQATVSQLQLEWSPANFRNIFIDLLGRTEVLSPAGGGPDRSPGVQPEIAPRVRSTIVFALPSDAKMGDPLSYFQRAVDALGRTGEFRIDCFQYEQLAQLNTYLFWRTPAALVICANSPDQQIDLAGLENYRGPVLVLPTSAGPTDGPRLLTSGDLGRANAQVLPRRPIIPYFTASPSLPEGPFRICLFGFRHPSSNFERLLSKIQREQDTAIVYVVRTSSEESLDDALFDERLRAFEGQLKLTPLLQVHVYGLAHNANELIHWIGGTHLAVFANDPRYTDELSSICELALTTERAVTFTRAAPFPDFAKGTYVEDVALPALVSRGSAAQIKLYNEYSEGRFANEFLSKLDEVARISGPVVSGSGVAQRGSSTGAMMDGKGWTDPNGILDEETAAWLARAYEADTGAPKAPRHVMTLEAAYIRGQQAYLLAAAERLCPRSEKARVLFAGDASRSSVKSLIEMGYDLTPLHRAKGGAAGQFAYLFSSCALSGLDEAEQLLQAARDLLQPGGAGALTFFTREAFAADDPRENPDFPVIDPAELASLLPKFGLSLVGKPDWSPRRPAFQPRPFEPPLMGTLLFHKGGDLGNC